MIGPPQSTRVACGRHRAAGAWLGLAVLALLVSGGFAVLLLLMRAPWSFQGLLPAASFPAVLTVHVNLAVVVWFLAMAATFFVVNRQQPRPRADGAIFLAALSGVALMVASVFVPGGEAVMNNYVPMITNAPFGWGLMIFLGGVGCAALLAVRDGGPMPWDDLADAERLGSRLAAAVVLVALLAFATSASLLPAESSGAGRFELLFWAGGHLLQFGHTVLLLTTWVAITGACGVQGAVPPRSWAAALAFAAAPTLAAPIGFLHPITSPEHRQFFTDLMRWGTWPAVVGAIGLAVLAFPRRLALLAEGRLLRRILLYSAGLFSVGLVVGAFIRRDDLIVTAHYHGVVGAVTLAYMGWARVLAQRIGVANPDSRRAHLQASSFFGGMLALVTGLAIAGAAGAPRKTPSAGLFLDDWQRAAGLSLAGVGGLLAFLGVAYFLVSTLGALLAARRELG